MVVQSGLRRDGIAAAELRCPTLVIGADRDTLRSVVETRELAQTIARSTLVILEPSGHMLPLERPADLANTLKTWLHKTL